MMVASGGAAGAGVVVEGISVSAVAAGAGAAVAAVANAEGAKNALQMANQAGNQGGSSTAPGKGPDPSKVNPQSVLDGMSRNNVKHAAKHLSEFQRLDPNISAEKVREIGASLVRPENLLSSSSSTQMAFQGAVEIGGQRVTVRTVLNELGKLHSVHIRY
ncbi:hypothetical protein, partial [Corallococcus llansteffanensis]|uniref:hypothetical protein n=1 Tax=Corallococcus llansteffanensis TaxID=2316731 RepID=UPI001ABF396E